MKHILLAILICGCTYGAQSRTWLIEKAAVAVIQDQRVVIYPNPAIDRIYIKGGGASHVEIMNMIGEVVLKEDISNGMVSLAELKAGMYIIRIYETEGSLI